MKICNEPGIRKIWHGISRSGCYDQSFCLVVSCCNYEINVLFIGSDQAVLFFFSNWNNNKKLWLTFGVWYLVFSLFRHWPIQWKDHNKNSFEETHESIIRICLISVILRSHHQQQYGGEKQGWEERLGQ